MADPRMHGPEFCSRVCSTCVCEDGKSRHHWMDDGFDPTEDPETWFVPNDPTRLAILAFDREHGTSHAEAY